MQNVEDTKEMKENNDTENARNVEKAEKAKNTENIKEKKKYPDAVVLRKGIVIVAIGVVCFIFVLVFAGIYHSSHKKAKEAVEKSTSTTVVNNTPKPDWYQNKEVRKPTVRTMSQDNAQNKQNTQNTQDTNKPAVQLAIAQTVDNQQSAANFEELKKAMSAPISANQISPESGGVSSAQSVPLSQKPPERSGENVASTHDDSNLQSEKKAFLKMNNQAEEDYLHEPVKNPLTPYELKAGGIIPAILITGINSELPGQITAQVRANVYDTVSGKYLLIPQGAKLTGLYDSQIAYGQERVLIAWKRIIFPNGQSINLEGMPGIDLSGYAGFHDQVNNHYGKIFGSVILMSIISAGAQLSQPQQQFSTTSQLSVSQMLAASLGTNIMNTANMMTAKNLNIQPTLVIKPGYLFNVSITKDMVFPSAYDNRTSYEN